MQTFQHFFVTEARLPYVQVLLNFLKQMKIAQKIKIIGNKKNPHEIEHVDAISHFNPYSKKEEVVDIYLNFLRNDTLGICAKAKKKRTSHGKVYWIIVLYWNNIKEMQSELGVPLDNLIYGRIYHELTHAIDPTPKNTKYDEDSITNNPMHRMAYLSDRREVNARMADITHTIKQAVDNKHISLKEIQYHLSEPTRKFVLWIIQYKPELSESLWHYVINKPEIIRNLRQILYNEIFNSLDRELPTPKKVRSILWR
ncbi:MAG: hypothetical protein WC905_03655 [Patescibacteria group bacterium]|jgi:hypothetical protein